MAASGNLLYPNAPPFPYRPLRFFARFAIGGADQWITSRARSRGLRNNGWIHSGILRHGRILGALIAID